MVVTPTILVLAVLGFLMGMAIGHLIFLGLVVMAGRRSKRRGR